MFVCLLFCLSFLSVGLPAFVILCLCMTLVCLVLFAFLYFIVFCVFLHVFIYLLAFCLYA